MCPDKTGIDASLRVWAYDGLQAQFSSGGTTAGANVWTNSGTPSTVTVVNSDINDQDMLPVLCFVGEEYVNHAWNGNANTPDSYTQKVRKPVRGYSTLVSCMDTSDYTVNEARFEYSPQSQKKEKYIFVQVNDVPEKPTFDESNLVVTIGENNNVGSLVENLTGKDEDPGDAMNLTFSLIGVSPATLSFELGAPETIYPYQSSRAIPLLIRTALDFEAQPVHTMELTITDSSQRTATQSITIQLNDVNEPPVLRELSNPSLPSADSPAIYNTFTIREDASSNFEIGELKAWDPDNNDLLVFTVSGTDNNGGVFGVSRTDRTSSGAGATGNMTVAVLELRNSGSIDYETKQSYTLDLEVSDGMLADTAKVVIDIINVNDVTVEDVQVVSTNETVLQTEGNELIHITGTNFGIKYGANAALKSVVKVKYGRLDKDRNTQWFTAQNCFVDSASTANTLIACNSAAGFGEKLVWNVQVLGNSEGVADSSVTTNYATPVIANIVLAASKGAANTLDTRGGTQLLLTGTNLGIAGLALEGYFTADPAAGWYKAENCVVTLSNTNATCDTVAGIGQNMVWKLEKVDHEWFGATSVATVTTGYQIPSIMNVTNSNNQKEFSTHGNQDVYIEV